MARLLKLSRHSACGIKYGSSTHKIDDINLKIMAQCVKFVGLATSCGGLDLRVLIRILGLDWRCAG
jgi:hypothetical protein